MKSMKYDVVTAVALAACGTMLSGCSGSPASKGGDATCGEYLQMSDDEQTEAITLLLKEDGDEPSNGEILLAKASATLYCSTAGSDSSPIRDING